MKILILFFLGFAFLSVCYADKEGSDKTEIAKSKNEKYVCVILKKDHYRLALVGQNMSRDIVDPIYPVSGLYTAADNKLVWEYRPSLEEHMCEPTNDGEYIIARGRSRSNEHLAFAIYKQAKLVKYVQIKDVCNDKKYLPRSVSHVHWLQSKINLDDDKKVIRFQSCNKNVEISLINGRVRKLPINSK